MLYENIKKILDTAKEKDVDILVAREMLIAENKEAEADFASACTVILGYYKFITACRRKGDEETIKTLCELFEKGETKALTELVTKYLAEE